MSAFNSRDVDWAQYISWRLKRPLKIAGEEIEVPDDLGAAADARLGIEGDELGLEEVKPLHEMDSQELMGLWQWTEFLQRKGEKALEELWGKAGLIETPAASAPKPYQPGPASPFYVNVDGAHSPIPPASPATTDPAPAGDSHSPGVQGGHTEGGREPAVKYITSDPGDASEHFSRREPPGEAQMWTRRPLRGR
jgi:hypothetical protein